MYHFKHIQKQKDIVMNPMYSSSIFNNVQKMADFISSVPSPLPSRFFLSKFQTFHFISIVFSAQKHYFTELLKLEIYNHSNTDIPCMFTLCRGFYKHSSLTTMILRGRSSSPFSETQSSHLPKVTWLKARMSSQRDPFSQV